MEEELKLKRMNYFDGLLLKADDYKTDKEYQRRLQGFHNRYLHTWGIISGLEVKPVTGSEMEVYVTEGSALDLTENGNYGSNVSESISRQILIYEGHPDNPVDLSEYAAGTNIYICVSYYETNADRDTEKGQGEEIHIWERGLISHTSVEPDNREKVILARVVPKTVVQKGTDDVGNEIDITEVVVDNTCIFDTYPDGTPLRIYAGPYATELTLEKFTFKFGDNVDIMPYIAEKYNEIDKERYLSIDNTESTKFTGNLFVSNDLTLTGELVSRKDGVPNTEFKTEESTLKLNARGKTEWKPRNCGMEVYRGGPNVAPDARIVWSESDKKWKAGLGNELYEIAYGEKWERLKAGPLSIVDDMHQHGRLYSAKGQILGVEEENLSINNDIILNNKDINLISKDGDSNKKHGTVAWYGAEKSFNGLAVDGVVLAGESGGLLGTTEGGEKTALSWKGNNVGIGMAGSSDDKLITAGSARLLSGLNPIRFTSGWTGFPDLTLNRAEICNDTTNYKALMIVGNQSAGQGRKVAIWDRLDVGKTLYVNGSMQMSGKLAVTAGSGDSGIVFPSDPGGGAWDRAWIKYYPRTGEACVLDIGTTNDGNDNISFMAAGNVGIRKSVPEDKLDIYDQMRIMSGTNPIRFTSQWSGFPEQASNRSEICNDTNTYKSLMIAGNRSAGSERRVSIWDHLDVNGPLNVSGSISVNGAIVPGVGNCEVKGIMFPKDPGGGSGDAAWLRYYSDTRRGGGENMTLEIGISNDSNAQRIQYQYWTVTCPWGIPNGCGYWTYIDQVVYGNGGDRLKLHANGGVYVDGNFYYTSSREYKENIKELDKTTAQDALELLEPVEYNFKGDNSRTTMGFIAEDIPDIVAANDKKAISPMEIITILVSEVKVQEAAIANLKHKIAVLRG